MSTITHMCVNIRGFMRNAKFPRGYRNVIVNDEGKMLSPEDAREYLFDCLAKGWKVLPLGECEGFSHETGCPGHACEEEE